MILNVRDCRGSPKGLFRRNGAGRRNPEKPDRREAAGTPGKKSKNKLRIMAEPYDIKNNHVPEIYNCPKQKAITKGGQKGCVSINEA